MGGLSSELTGTAELYPCSSLLVLTGGELLPVCITRIDDDHLDFFWNLGLARRRLNTLVPGVAVGRRPQGHREAQLGASDRIAHHAEHVVEWERAGVYFTCI